MPNHNILRNKNIPNEQPPTENIRLREWLSRMMTLINGVFTGLPTDSNAETVIASNSFVAQNPTGLDTPMLISWGPAYSSDILDLAATGEITIHQDEQFDFYAFLQLSRTGHATDSYIIAHGEVNGFPVATSWAINLDRSPDYFPLYLAASLDLKAGDIVTFYLTRDSIGADDGGLVPFVPTNPAVPSTASSRLVVTRTILE